MSKNYEKDGVSQYFRIEGVVSNSFNRLKGKLFNLIEATITDKQQCDAVKGLIKGFANDEYTDCATDMRYHAKDIGLLTNDEVSDFPPMSASPLETQKVFQPLEDIV